MAFGRLVLLAVLALADDAGEAAVRSEGACASPEPDACIGRPESRFTLAFGSCHHQAKPAPTLLAAAASAPDVFVFLGDNLYNDVDRWGMPCEPLRCAGRLRTLTSPLLLGLFKLLPLALKRIVYRAFATRLAGGTLSPPSLEGDGAALAAHYAALGAKAEVIALRAAVPLILATWDDHDYGRNDAGAGYAHARESRAEFVKFWRGRDADDAPKPTRGVYASYTLDGGGGRVVRVILLDLRTYRTAPLRPEAVPPAQRAARCAAPDGAASLGEYCTHAPNATATLLGAEQWAWLEAQLRAPADVRLVCSSLAVWSQFHAMEAWSLFPGEQRRLVQLLLRTRADGVVFLSGDVHYAELSVRKPTQPDTGRPDDLYPLYDLASSGLNQDWPVAPANSERLAGPVHEHNWGRVAVDWARRELELEVRDARGAVALRHVVSLDALRFPASARTVGVTVASHSQLPTAGSEGGSGGAAGE